MKAQIVKTLVIFAIVVRMSSADYAQPDMDELIKSIFSLKDQDVLVKNNEEALVFASSLETFVKRLFEETEKANKDKNIIISPFSIETCIAMLRMAAEGQTALEIDNALASAAQNPEQLANSFHTILAQYENDNALTIANKIYTMNDFDIQEEFSNLLTKKFLSSAEPIDFGNNVAAAKTMNDWVESKTNKKIRNLVDAGSLDDTTSMVLLNAIHFESNWLHQFKEEKTTPQPFYLDETKNVQVEMMSMKKTLSYGYFSDLDATVVNLPYNNSDLSFLVILPNSRTGLADLEKNLKTVPIGDITKQMGKTTVALQLPKFKAEFEIELNEPLQNLGMRRMFSSVAEFGKALECSPQMQVSKFVHKAVIEVNEKGSQAAAATAVELNTRFGEDETYEFNANRPFVYFIKNANNVVFFQGNVKNFNK